MIASFLGWPLSWIQRATTRPVIVSVIGAWILNFVGSRCLIRSCWWNVSMDNNDLIKRMLYLCSIIYEKELIHFEKNLWYNFLSLQKIDKWHWETSQFAKISWPIIKIDRWPSPQATKMCGWPRTINACCMSDLGKILWLEFEVSRFSLDSYDDCYDSNYGMSHVE